MSLTKKQFEFSKNVAKLISFAYSKGYTITLGEAYRTMYQQREYVRQGLSKTLKSAHLNRLAIDLNLFKDGKYLATSKDYKQLAEYWKTLNPANEAGYYWGWDANHFEMK